LKNAIYLYYSKTFENTLSNLNTDISITFQMEGRFLIDDSLTTLSLSLGEKRNLCRLLVGKPEGKRQLGRPRRRWIDNIKMDLLEIGLSVVDWIGLAQDMYRWRAPVNAVMNLRVP
jgi:hypothetical protein